MRYEEVAGLKVGQGLLGASKATDEQYKRRAQLLELRDSILWTAGETRGVAA